MRIVGASAGAYLGNIKSTGAAGDRVQIQAGNSEVGHKRHSLVVLVVADVVAVVAHAEVHREGWFNRPVKARCKAVIRALRNAAVVIDAESGAAGRTEDCGSAQYIREPAEAFKSVNRLHHLPVDAFVPLRRC